MSDARITDDSLGRIVHEEANGIVPWEELSDEERQVYSNIGLRIAQRVALLQQPQEKPQEVANLDIKGKRYSLVPSDSVQPHPALKNSVVHKAVRSMQRSANAVETLETACRLLPFIRVGSNGIAGSTALTWAIRNGDELIMLKDKLVDSVEIASRGLK